MSAMGYSPQWPYALRELLPPRRRPVEVHEQAHVPRRREQVRVPAGVELVARDAVRPAVNHMNERVLLRGVEPGWHDEVGLHGVAARALELDFLDVPEQEVLR